MCLAFFNRCILMNEKDELLMTFFLTTKYLVYLGHEQQVAGPWLVRFCHASSVARQFTLLEPPCVKKLRSICLLRREPLTDSLLSVSVVCFFFCYWKYWSHADLEGCQPVTHTLGCFCSPDGADSAKPSVASAPSKSFLTIPEQSFCAHDGRWKFFLRWKEKTRVPTVQ